MKGIVFVAVMVACVGVAVGIKCQVCSSVLDSKCARSYGYAKDEASLSQDCGSGSTYCTKSDVKLLGTETTSRGCGGAVCSEVHSPEALGTKTDTYCCQGDNCNAASSVTISLIAAIATLVASLCLTQ